MNPEDSDERGVAMGRRLRESLGKRSVSALAREVGVAASTMSGYASGAVPPADVAVVICRALGVDLAWYLTGRPPAPAATWLPGPDGAAGGAHVPDPELRALGVDPSSAMVLLVTGSAMEPAVPAGALALVDGARREPEDGRVYAVSVRGRVLVRRLQISGSHGLLAACDNPAFSTEPIDVVHSAHVLGEVVRVSHAP